MSFDHALAMESNAPAQHAAAVTPHDTNNLTMPTRALWVGTAGDVKLLLVGDTSPVIFVGVSGLLPVSAIRVYDADTDADDIVAIW